MKKIYLAGMFVALMTQATAQIPLYQFSANSGAFTPLPASATAVTQLLDDDAFSAAIPIGFNFVYNGISYTNIFANSNGFLSFAATATPAQQRVNSAANATNIGPAIFPLWDDCIGYELAPTSSIASYQVTGAVGSRVFTFEWKNWVWYFNFSNIGPTISFQVKLYEGSNNIEFVYRTEPNNTLNTPSATIGLGGANGTEFLVLSDSGASPATSSQTFISNIAARPANGQVYRFQPPAACATPTAQPSALNFNAIEQTGLSGAFTAPSPAADRYLVVRTTTNTQPVPVNGTNYAIGDNATLGGYVEQTGNATTFNSAGLSAGTTYYYWVFSYSYSCTGGPLYYTTAPLTGSITTAANRVTATSGDWNNPATWVGGVLPSAIDAATIAIGHTVTIAPTSPTVRTLNVSINSTLNLNGGTLTINGSGTTGINNSGTISLNGGNLQLSAPGQNNRSFVNNSGSTLAVANGNLNVYGNVAINNGANFNQSGGIITVDGNNGGTATNSVATGLPIFAIGSILVPRSSGTISLTGGSIVLVDPHTGTGINDFAFYYNGTFGTTYNITAGPNHTLQVGNGVSTDAGGSADNLFSLNFWAGYSGFKPGNLVVHALSGTNRTVRSRYSPYIIGNNLTIQSGEFLDVSISNGPDNRLHLGGNLTVNAPGIFTAGASIAFDAASYNSDGNYTLSTGSATTLQTLSGNGLIRNKAINPTANMTGLFLNNSSGVTIQAPLSVSDSLSANTPVLNMGNNLLTVGTSVAAPGIYLPQSGYLSGKLRRWIPAVTGTYNFNLGTGSGLRTAAINFTTAPTGGGTLTAEWIGSNAGVNGLPLNQGPVVVSQTAPGYWRITAADGLNGGIYTGTFTAGNLSGVADYTELVLLKRTNELSPWTLSGTHITTSGTNTSPVLSRSGMSDFSDFSIGSSSNNPLPVTLLSFGGRSEPGGNKLYWTTVSEKDNKAFILQRSADGNSFADLVSLNSKAPGGNSSERNDYSYVDLLPLSGDNFYRLVQVDHNGHQSRSQTLLIRAAAPAATDIRLYPNPAVDQLQVELTATKDQSFSIVIADLAGRVVLREQVEVHKGVNLLSLGLSGLGQGIYLLHASSETTTMPAVKFRKL